MKILSLNLFEGGVLFDAITQFLVKEQPDIAFFQEARDRGKQNEAKQCRSLEEIKRIFPDYFINYQPEIGDHQISGIYPSGNLLVSKYPIKTAKQTFFDNGYVSDWKREEYDGDYRSYPSSMQICDIEIGKTIYTCINVHGIWGFDGKDNEQRERMGDKIMQVLHEKPFVLMAGYFNLQPTTQVVQRIETKLKNVFKYELITTFNMKHKSNPGFATAVVDMMFVTPGIKVVKHYCPDVDISDHKPLVAILELPKD